MGFGDLKSNAGLQTLNDYLLDKSYIEGYQPSQADVAVLEALSGAPSEELCNALRWYSHIKSYSSEAKSLPGAKKSVDQYGPAGAAPAKPAAESDDDDDLFGSDSEEDEEEMAALEKKREEAVAKAKEAKKKKSTVIAKSNIILAFKAWDDETDIKEIEKVVRAVEHQGLTWGASKIEPVAYGVHQLKITAVVVDDECGTDVMEEIPDMYPDLIQSVDIVAFNKV